MIDSEQNEMGSKLFGRIVLQGANCSEQMKQVSAQVLQALARSYMGMSREHPKDNVGMTRWILYGS